MFLDQVQKLGLLEHDESSHILRDFPLAVRRTLVEQVVTHLLRPDTSPTVLSSKAHVVYALETCGQGFGLPIEDEAIILQVIELYRSWILEARKPPPVTQDRQFFLRVMLKHYSLLFRYRTDPLVQQHADLCSRVLHIFVTIGRMQAAQLDQETWEVFLRLMIGIADSLFSAPSTAQALGRQLCQQTLSVLFELWLHSQTRNPEMWEALSKAVRRWTGLMQLVDQWKVTALALTNRTLAIMYGPAAGTESVLLKTAGDAQLQQLRLDDEYVFYAWHRMLHILGNPNESIAQPDIFKEFMTGLERLVQLYLDVQRPQDTGTACVLPPSGNTILHVFGQWLFQAVQLHRPSFDEGTAIAVRVMCNVFITRHTTEYLSIYLASFYSALQRVLLQDGRVLISAILNAESLLSCKLAGSRVLLPAFVYAITRIMKGTVNSYSHICRQDLVRHACIRLLATILCLPNYFGTAKFMHSEIPRLAAPLPKNDASAAFLKIFEVEKYADLKPHLDYVLLESLKSEKDDTNLQELLHLCFTYQCENIKFDPTFSLKSIAQVLRSIIQHKWQPAVSLTALAALGRMSFLYPHLPKNEEQASDIVSQLCAYVVENTKSAVSAKSGGDGNEAVSVSLVEYAFRAITDWVMVDQWLLAHQSVVRRLVEAVVVATQGCRSSELEGASSGSAKGSSSSSSSLSSAASGSSSSGGSSSSSSSSSSFSSGKEGKEGKEGKSKRDKKEKRERRTQVQPPVRIQRAARFALDTVMTRLGAFPTPSAGPSSVSSVLLEEQYLLDLQERGIEAKELKQYMRVFLVEKDLLVTVLDRPFEESGPFATLVVRSPTGRYTWDCARVFLPFERRLTGASRTPERCAVPVPITMEPYRAGEPEVDAADLSTVLSWFDAHPQTAVLAELAAQQSEREQQHLSAVHHHLDAAVTVQQPEPCDPYAGPSKLQAGRMLLAHLGWLSLESWSQVRLVELSTSLFGALHQLDQSPERYCQKVAVLYCGANQRDYADMLKNEAGSEDYQEFVSALGWGVNPAAHAGFLGGLDHKPSGNRPLIHGEVAPYYADYCTEVIFHVATLMPTNKAQEEQHHKTRLIGSDYVAVVWCEGDLAAYRPNFSKDNMVQILVKPILTSLYRVRICCKDSGLESGVGPLTTNMLVSKNILATLVRETAIRAYRLCCTLQQELDDPYHTRRRLIADITRKNAPTATELEPFFTGVCGVVPPGQQGPSLANVSPVPISSSFLPAHSGKSSRGNKIQLGSRSNCDVPAAAGAASSRSHRGSGGGLAVTSSSSAVAGGKKKGSRLHRKHSASQTDSAAAAAAAAASGGGAPPKPSSGPGASLSAASVATMSGGGSDSLDGSGEAGSGPPPKPSRTGALSAEGNAARLRGLSPRARAAPIPPSGGDAPPPKPSRPPRS